MKQSPLVFALSIMVAFAITACSYAQNSAVGAFQETSPDTTPDTTPEAIPETSPEPSSGQQDLRECVILLHGLARTSKSMIPFSDYLQTQGYRVVNVDYPSRDFPIATLTEKAIPPALASCRQQPISGIHFVTHSLGGILVRQYLSKNKIPELKRVVMLSPPNKGSQVVDNLKELPPFDWLNGPAGSELGTDSASIPNNLGPINFELGVIAGTTSINFILSLYLPNPDDGKVSVANTKIDGMRDFISLPVSHPYIMKDEDVMEQTLHFLQQGTFIHTPATDEHKDL